MKKFLFGVIKFAIKTVLLVIVATMVWVALYRYVNPPLTPLMVIGYFGGKRTIKKEWSDYKNISNYMKLAVIAAEDQKFPTHEGFDIESIKDAIGDKMSGDRLRGASTISQQTAKNVFLWPSRTWMRKTAEAYFTFLIEKIWGKKRILEVYLNVIETGKGVYGVGKAGEVYFGKSAGNLTKEESALIAAILPNPVRMSAVKPSRYVRERQGWIIGQMDNLGTGYLKRIK
ncbi:MAG: monofunctional biosynthetic peptidoglycan transglycosylase [Candidatus Dadabacteria bacterium RIFCSPHIGHO2_12_FULL_53_21]|nr:MAG: monofunctional biosynthetic peptidoglycan transglycosylase [Candidatus Dadabacteria bacterium RIFCSPHIGHO2_12_FULL_53_21]